MMKAQLRLLAIAATIAMSALSVAHSALAAGQQPIVVGVVDADQVFQDSKAGKSIRAQLTQQKKAFQAEVEKQQKLFDDAKQKLLGQRSTMSADDFKKKADDLSRQGDQIQNNLAQRQQQLENGLAKTKDQLYQVIEQVTQDVAKAHGMTLVINRAAVLVYDTSYEITNEVVQKLDAKLPSIKLSSGSAGSTGSAGSAGAAAGSTGSTGAAGSTGATGSGGTSGIQLGTPTAPADTQ